MRGEEVSGFGVWLLWTILLSVRGFVGTLMEVGSCLFDSKLDGPCQ